ncbi:NACHT, LRR and PYD domains-containing protein 12 isoform X3 [Myxocyprinus asiaticus]|uniref:NACHT, LRR and PYD domains-containing protein 12 isoform X3 n=1 Tax=Myxocyprinus asiaticus TaxID=70543 RepID=UPI0022229D4B|nr:NACHT, LRR and PYD domains-containing protein 12 isoform X3 [Myxocyprinus asiaticus]
MRCTEYGTMASNKSPTEEHDTETVKNMPPKRKLDSPEPEPSCVSLKTDASMDPPIKFSSGDSSAKLRIISNQRSDSPAPEPSCVSMKSNQSIDPPSNFSLGDSADVSNKQEGSKSCAGKKKRDSIFKELEQKIFSLMKKELERFKTLLKPDYPACSEREEEEEDDEGQRRFSEGFLKITLHVLRMMNQTDLADALQTKHILLNQQKLKSRLKQKFQRINEGFSNQRISTLLNEIYTELYITEGWSGDINNEHEVRQMETTYSRSGTPIKCNDIFKHLPQQKPIRTVLTRGVAGIGKTVSVQKFILDWAEEKANQDVHFIFPLPLRELNLIKEKRISLMEILHKFFTEMNELKSIDYKDLKIIFIFDGLDECRLPLDFQNNEILWDVTESASVDVLLTNLIKGNLLPSALLWITSRPAAANLIPPECVDKVTEVRGFNDPKKDEYFSKRINDQRLANRIITHIKSSRSLYIMCHVPVFCWISATVLERMLRGVGSVEIPKTLTQMFIHFLIFQTKLKTQKYDGKCKVDLQQDTDCILSLGKLAFEQLEKGNLIFYEEDLRACAIDVREASVYSGVCTQIFREEFGLCLGKVFSFVHLSVQEFLAALFKFLSFLHEKEKTSTMTDFLKSEVDKTLQSENGHLDLYLRFLLGLSLESNQTLLQGLLVQTGNSHSKQEIVEYIKLKIRENPSPEKSINLFHCLNELNDHSLVMEVQSYLSRTGTSRLSGVSLSLAQWSALVFALLNSEQELDNFRLSEYYLSEECLLRLLPVVKASRKADLSGCNLTEKICSALASALSSNSSSLRMLDLSNNDLQDSGVKLLSAGLKNCKLDTFKISNCSIGEEGCSVLVSALSSNPSHLRELNLNCNKPGDSAVKLLSDLLKDPQCKLERLQLEDCSIREDGCAVLISALCSNPSHLRELNLNYNTPGDLGVKKLSKLLEEPHCKLEKLQLSHCSIGGECCAVLVSALRSNPSHLRELNLNCNEPGDSAVNLLSDLLKDPHCKLEKIELECCCIGEDGCAVLISALSSNPSHLKELSLNYNEPGDSAVKLLSDLLEDPHCKLEKLELWNCSIGEEGCSVLVSALRSNPSHLRELNLNYNKPGDSAVKLLSDLLKDSHCKLEKLELEYCSIGEEGCSVLASALKSNPSHLRELNLSRNDPGYSGVKLLSDLLKDPHCKLEKLELDDCSIGEEGCAVLVSALRSNPSHLRELNLNNNKPVHTGVKLLYDLLKNPHCKLKKLQLECCGIGEEGCAALALALRSNPTHLRELNLNYNTPGDLGVKLLSDLLLNPHCKLEKLELSHCSIREEGCAVLVSALRSNPSHLRELNLNYNQETLE